MPLASTPLATSRCEPSACPDCRFGTSRAIGTFAMGSDRSFRIDVSKASESRLVVQLANDKAASKFEIRAALSARGFSATRFGLLFDRTADNSFA
jgi:hypothetical protein